MVHELEHDVSVIPLKLAQAKAVARNRFLLQTEDFQATPEDLLFALRRINYLAQEAPLLGRAQEAVYTILLGEINTTSMDEITVADIEDLEQEVLSENEAEDVDEEETQNLDELLAYAFSDDDDEAIEELIVYLDECDDYERYGDLFIEAGLQDPDAAMVAAVQLRLDERNLNLDYQDLDAEHPITLESLIWALEEYLEAKDRLDAFEQEFFFEEECEEEE